MSVRSNANFEEAEEAGDAELVLSVITYTGSRSTYYNNNTRTQGGYPSLDGFQRDLPKIAKIPSNKLGWWENHADFEISYTEEDIAQALYDSNYVASQLVGTNVDTRVRDLLVSRLDLEASTTAEGYREQLAEIVGDEFEEEEDPVQQSRADTLANDTERSVLITVASSFDDSDEWVEDAGKAQITHMKQTELAEFLAGKKDNVVDRRIDTAAAGGDI